MSDRLKPRLMPTPTNAELQAELRSTVFGDATRWGLSADGRYGITVDVSHMPAWQRLPKVDGEVNSMAFGTQLRELMRSLDIRVSGKDVQLTRNPAQPDQWQLSLPGVFGPYIDAAIKTLSSQDATQTPGRP